MPPRCIAMGCVCDAIAISAATSVCQAALFLGALRASVVVRAAGVGSTAEDLARMLGDADARRLIADASALAVAA